ncbi:hypothetical protein HN51_052121 [Arachis hypogaea]
MSSSSLGADPPSDSSSSRSSCRRCLVAVVSSSLSRSKQRAFLDTKLIKGERKFFIRQGIKDITAMNFKCMKSIQILEPL